MQDLMIDWLTVVVPFRHSTPVEAGQISYENRYGVIEWSNKVHESVEGSYSSKVQVSSHRISRTPDGVYQELWISGNFVKWFQGHNVFGTCDLNGLVTEMFLAICGMVDLSPTQGEIERIHSGYYRINRIDLTRMIELPSEKHVEAFLYSADRYCSMRHRGRGVMTKGTLYFGKNSSRSTLKMYAKGPEFRKRAHNELPFLESLLAWSSNKLRIELTLRKKELEKRGLSYGHAWQDDQEQFNQWQLETSKLNMNAKHTLPPDTITELPGRLIGVYHLWREGHDISTLYPTSTYYRYRSQLAAHGIDISVKQDPDSAHQGAEIVNFANVLEPRLVEQVPSWAYGTNSYFEPRAAFRNNQATLPGKPILSLVNKTGIQSNPKLLQA